MICFVCDNFVKDKNGGAELSLEALIEKCPEDHIEVRSKDFDLKKVSGSRLIVFSNIAELDFSTLRNSCRGLKYVFIENDYKYCVYRNPLKHKAFEGVDCDCHKRPYGRAIVDFMIGAKMLFWKSVVQRDIYCRLFPELLEKKSEVISCNFTDKDLDRLLELRKNKKNGKYLVMKSDSWVKGVEASKQECKKLGLKFKVVGGISYDKFLDIMSKFSGLAFAPIGYDTCPRMVAEAKIMGLDVLVNDNVQSAKEEWLNRDCDAIVAYLRERPERFWEKAIAV